MSKKKNLERAIVLGLILSTGVYGNVLAADPVGIGIDQFKGDAKNGVITVNEDTIVKGTGVYGPDVSSDSGQGGNAEVLKNSLFYRDGELLNLTISAGDGVQLTFHNVNMLSPHIVRNGDGNGADIIILDNKENVDKTFAGISVTGIIEGNSLTVNSGGRGIYTGVDNTKYPVIDNNNPFYGVKIDVINGFEINSASDGIFNEGDSESDVTITAGSVYIENTDRNGIYNAGQSTDAGNNVTVSAVSALDGNIVIKSHGIGDDQASVKNKTSGTTALTASGIIDIYGAANGIYATKGTVNLSSKDGNSISAKVYEGEDFKQRRSISAEGGSQVNLNAIAGSNVLNGVIFAKDDTTSVTLKHNILNEEGNVVKRGSGSNYIYSSSKGSKDTVGDRSDVVAALYAQNEGRIELAAGEGGINYIESFYTDLDNSNTSNDSERTVWAQRGGVIDINGTTVIKSSNAENFYEDGYATNSRGVAITAGSGDITTDPIPEGVRSTVNVEYGGAVTLEDKTTFSSAIYGDIAAGYGGLINISRLETNGNYGLHVEGNALAANGGELNLDLGNGGVWYGRADDYGDAGYNNDAENNDHDSFYNPIFSNEITEGGKVNITMGDNAEWNLTGQSWVSSLDVTNANGNATINMAYDGNTHGLTIGELKGVAGGNSDATFTMSLNHDNHLESDMLYAKNATGEYNVVINDMIEGIENINEDNVLRFATVKGGATFNNVTMKDTGFYNLAFEVDHSEYDVNDTENTGYNGSAFGTEKPGKDNVDDFFELKNDEETQSKIMLLDENTQQDTNSVENWYITRVKSQEMSDAGKTMLNMSRANYSNAIYMDRLNKRLGEARYINSEEDEGMWVRIRHDRIGKDAAYRSQNTMYELGYDQKQECDNGERRVGMAIDYMHGDTGYNDIAGKGEIDRYGLWLYDTWMGDKGHYADYVAKWGHLSNDFEIYNSSREVTGDYSNNVFSISAEYGKKNDMGNDWYFEPQVQAQLARVTGADYTTSQGTKVSVDGINSLIGRAGFRIGKDFGAEKQSTVYLKADVLHEFLGDQTIRALDDSTDGRWADVSYENEGTWYDVGFGFATQISKASYAFMDFEKSFGNDNDETYQINVGMQWSF